MYRLRKNSSSRKGGSEIKEITALLLAAGESKRYGSNKLLSLYKDKYLIQHSLDLIRRLFQRKVIVLGKYSDEIKDKCDLDDFYIVHNNNYMNGLSSSLKEGIKIVNTEWTMIFLADMPEIQDDFINKLYENIDNNHIAYYLTYNNKKGFPVLINKSLYKEVFKVSGDKGLRFVLRNEKIAKAISVNSSKCLFDIDKAKQND